jgi:predicted nucleotidyltransferase
MPIASESQLQELTAAIVRKCQPSRIVLFGSQARGNAHDDSDIDLLVVDSRPFSRVRSRRREIAEIRRSLPPLGIPIDLLLFDDVEYQKWKETTNHVIAEAVREGRVLHERS